MEHIAKASLLDHVEVGVIDLAHPKPFIASYGFHLYGNQAPRSCPTSGPRSPPMKTTSTTYDPGSSNSEPTPTTATTATPC